jgi:tetratricopeptide (TPR) repeat protein
VPVAKQKKVELPHLLIEAVKEKRAVLVFGAGASKEASRSDGSRPPNGDQMRDVLAKKFLGTSDEKRDLMTVAEMAIESGAGEPLVFEEVAKMVSGFPASEAHKTIAGFSWRGLATTNYDTLIETGNSEATDRKQVCLPFVKDSEPYDDRLDAQKNSVALLKLHGCVNHRLDKEIPLVLSHEHYHRVRDNRVKLLQRLQHWAESSVLIFIGYRLADTHIRDLIYEIDSGRRPQWYIVTPTADVHDKNFWSKKSVDLIEATFGEFTCALEQKIEPLFRALSAASATVDLPIHKHFRSTEVGSGNFNDTLKNDLEHVGSGVSFDEIEPKKFYSGYDRAWCGIIRKYDFPRKVGERLLYAALEEDASNDPKFLLLTGSAGAGKTIALRRAAYDAAVSLDELVFWLKDGGVPRIEFFKELYDLTGKRAVVFVDQISVHEGPVLRLLEASKYSKIPLTIVGADREADWSNYCSEIEQNFPPQVFALGRLSASEAEDLVVLLERHDCLGLLKRKTKSERVDAFLKEDQSDRQLLVALHELTQGKPFEEIILEEYNRILPESARRLYLDIATMHQFGVTARAGAISRISGVRFSDFEADFFKPLKDIVRIVTQHHNGDKGYETRHTRVSSIVFGVACNSDEEKSAQLVRIISGLDAGFSSDKKIIEKVCKGRAMAAQFTSIVPAREIFEMACSAAPSSAFLYQQAAILEYLHAQGSLDRAQELAETARVVDDNNHIYIHTLAEVMRRKANAAENNIRKEQLRSQSRSYLNEIWLKDARVASSFCNLLVDEAIDLLKALPSDPKDHEILAFDSKTDDAVERIKRAMQDFPDTAEFSSVEARLWQQLGENDRAKTALTKAIRAKPRNSSAFLRLSNIHRQASAPESTLEVLQNGLEKFPNDKNLHLKIALHLVETTDKPTDEMDIHFRSSFAAGDHNFDGRFFYAEYLFWAGKIEEATKLFAEIDRRAAENFRKTAPSSDDLLTSKLGRYQGVIEGVNSRYFFVRFGGYPKAVFAFWRSWSDPDYDMLRTGDQVSFKLRFNRKGPVAVEVRAVHT